MQIEKNNKMYQFNKTYHDAFIKFNLHNNDSLVKSYLLNHHILTKKNIIIGRERDIGFWISKDWTDFKQFVDQKSNLSSKSELNKNIKKQAINVYRDDKIRIIIPTTELSAIKYGKNTSWCVSSTESKNKFDDYFHHSQVTIFYIFINDDKIALALYPNHIDYEIFDSSNNKMSLLNFIRISGLNLKPFYIWLDEYSSNLYDIRHY